MEYYAHSLKEENKSKWQKLEEHLINVATLARKFADEFGAGDFGYIAGLYHDIGKYSVEFQNRLEGKGCKVDHSTAGAKEIINAINGIGILPAYCIAGHHVGLPDYIGNGDDSSLYARKDKYIPDYSAFKNEIEEKLIKELKPPQIKIEEGKAITLWAYFFVRMIFSCLVDADFFDTENFYDEKKSLLRERDISIKELKEKLDKHLDSIFKKTADSSLNKERSEVMKCCLKKAEGGPGFYTLTVPTGGGKTFSSLSFALKHASKNDMRKVIYVIPYTSIIEQNADVFKEALGNNCVLEHHSNYDYKEGADDESENDYKMKLSAENWNMPIIATTNVQFFESLFSNRSSRCRKLHNIVNSVIILDEAQMLPVEYLKPCLYALSELVINYKCTVVFCTATQPAIKEYQGLLPDYITPVEIMDDPEGLYKRLKAVNTKWVGEVKQEALVEKIAEYKQALCIVNTRKSARELYESLKVIKHEGIYHLSAAMYPAHRSKIINDMKNKLKDGLDCIVISTQLMEAGVDIDFPVVFREIAGLDSIAQAAGRCNRERKQKSADVFVFKIEGKKPPRGFLSRTADVAREVIDLNTESDVLGLGNIKKYFEKLYSLEGEGLDGKNILKRIEQNAGRAEYPFRSISDDFNIIQNNTYSLVVNKDDAKKIIEDAKRSQFPWSYARKLQRFTVQVYKQDYNKLLKAKKLELIKDAIFVLDESAYSDEVGVNIKEEENERPSDYII